MRPVPLFLSLVVALSVAVVAQEGTLGVDGDVELTCELTGEGHALVLIHGSTHDMKTWNLQAPALQRHFTVASDTAAACSRLPACKRRPGGPS